MKIFTFRRLLSSFAQLALCVSTLSAGAESQEKKSPKPEALPEVKISTGNQNPSVQDLSNETRMVLKAISERYKKFRIWEASFTQEEYSVGLQTASLNMGEFKFKYPKNFRYSLLSPEAADYVSDGKSFWQVRFKEGRCKPAYVRHADDLKKVELDKYLILLRGIDTLDKKKEAQLLSDFVITGETVQDELHLILEPRKSTQIVRIRMIFKQGGQALYRAILEDAIGNKTTITLTGHKIKKSFEAKTFTPDIPKDSKIEKL